MPSQKISPRPRIFYGWYILSASFVILFLTTGARFSFGVAFKSLMAEFGWNRGTVSLVFFINMTAYALSLIIAGRAYDRYGPKWVIVISTILLSAGFMSVSFIDTLWQFFICYGLLAAIGMSGTTVPLFAALMSKWFIKRRGLAVSLGLTGSCMGQFVLVPIFTIMVLRYGWRTSYFCLSLVMLVVIITLAVTVIKGDPEDFGLEPYGYDDRSIAEGQKDEKLPDMNPGDLGLKDAAKTYSFWLFVTVMFICGSGDFMVTTHLIPFVTDYDISPATAGNMLAWLGLMSLPGILIAGPLSDSIGNKIPIALTFVLRVFLFILLLKYHNLISLYIFALVFGFTLLITAPLNPILVGKLYGFSNVGLISGFITTIHHLGGGFWVYLGGWVFDRAGSYRLIFIISALIAFIAIFFTAMIKEKKHRVS